MLLHVDDKLLDAIADVYVKKGVDVDPREKVLALFNMVVSASIQNEVAIPDGVDLRIKEVETLFAVRFNDPTYPEDNETLGLHMSYEDAEKAIVENMAGYSRPLHKANAIYYDIDAITV